MKNLQQRTGLVNTLPLATVRIALWGVCCFDTY
jgi:hypothetical protein